MGLSFSGVAVLAVAAGLTPGDAPSKCAARAGAEHLPDFVVVVDGEVVDESPDSFEVAPDSVWSVQVICWDAAERLFDVRTRRGALAVVTRSGLLPMMRSYLRDLAVAQEQYRSREGVFATTLRDLEFFESHLDLPIEMTASSAGWSAVVRPTRHTHACEVAGGRGGSMDDGRVRCEAVDGPLDEGGAR